MQSSQDNGITLTLSSQIDGRQNTSVFAFALAPQERETPDDRAKRVEALAGDISILLREHQFYPR